MMIIYTAIKLGLTVFRICGIYWFDIKQGLITI